MSEIELARVGEYRTPVCTTGIIFAEPGPVQFRKIEKGPGRLERRVMMVSSELAEYSAFPGLKQVAELKKTGVFLKTGAIEENTEYIMTSLSAEQAAPDRILALMRGIGG